MVNAREKWLKVFKLEAERSRVSHVNSWINTVYGPSMVSGLWSTQSLPVTYLIDTYYFLEYPKLWFLKFWILQKSFLSTTCMVMYLAALIFQHNSMLPVVKELAKCSHENLHHVIFYNYWIHIFLETSRNSRELDLIISWTHFLFSHTRVYIFRTLFCVWSVRFRYTLLFNPTRVCVFSIKFTLR